MLKDKTTKKFTNPIAALHQIAEAIESDDHERAFNLNYETIGAEQIRNRLKDEANSIRRRMEQLVSQIDEEEQGGHASINSLGELQGSGVSLDILCARYCDARERLERVVRDIDKGERYE